jgi:hypothetical protein
MLKDAQIIQKALKHATKQVPDPEMPDILEDVEVDGLDALTDNERKYFFEIRKLYTPQQLQSLRGAVLGKDLSNGNTSNFNIVQFIKEINTAGSSNPPRVVEHQDY